ncbi:MAG: helix-turn-helix transcriptional regulator [Bifidobacterium castoris]|nr:helix-turn-helix transcriptional regulator [Bifidobacterium castoris]
MKSHDDNAAASAIRSLRIETLLKEVSKTELARATGLHRQTVAKVLKSNDMSLSTFIGLCKAADLNPAELVTQAIKEEESK